jgi:hypothetical protein
VWIASENASTARRFDGPLDETDVKAARRKPRFVVRVGRDPLGATGMGEPGRPQSIASQRALSVVTGRELRHTGPSSALIVAASDGETCAPGSTMRGTAVARSFFDIPDGKSHLDEDDGAEHATLDEVRAHAMAVLPDMGRDDAPKGNDRVTSIVLVSGKRHRPVSSATPSRVRLWLQR